MRGKIKNAYDLRPGDRFVITELNKKTARFLKGHSLDTVFRVVKPGYSGTSVGDYVFWEGPNGEEYMEDFSCGMNRELVEYFRRVN